MSTEAKDVIKVAMAMIATLAALVLGLMTASASSSLDDKETEMRSTAARVVLLDRTLAKYGPETQEARELLKTILAARIREVWLEETPKLPRPSEAIGSDIGVRQFKRSFSTFPAERRSAMASVDCAADQQRYCGSPLVLVRADREQS